MSEIKIKHRVFEIIEEKDSGSLIASYKGKKYYITKFEPKTQAGNEITFSCTRIQSAGIKAPRLRWVDKKLGYIVRELIEGVSVMELISKSDLEEDIYHQLFLNAYLAKINAMTLNYEPDKWIMSDGKLYYVYPHFIIFDKSKDLIDRYLRLWFPTKELVQFLSKNGLTFDAKRLKDEYTTNKEIVLMTLKHYK
ncbi:MAG: hypothetical protein K5925_03270 [Bacilli bacterium]|nr:hypothetical protein [Bacilli bacterium]